MRNNLEKVLAIWLCVVIFATSFFMAVNMNVSAYTTHDPIYINGNADFTAANGVSNPGAAGTATDPYIIEGWDISALSANGIEIRNTDAYFIIKNCYVHDGKVNYYEGIKLYDVKNGWIENTISSNNLLGIYLHKSSNNTIYYNIASNNNYGVSLLYSSDNNVYNNSANSNNGDGIYLDSSSYNIILNNIANSNDCYGLYLCHSSDNNIFNNSASNNHIGIWLDAFSSNNNISNNTVNSNNNFGIALYKSSNNNIFNNTANSNNGDGISVYYSSSNVISNNSVNSNSLLGIYLGYSSYNNICNNNVSKNDYGIALYESSNNNIFNNIAWSNWCGISLHYYSDNNNIFNNNAISNYWCGIYLWYSSNNDIFNNNFIDNGYQAYDYDGVNHWDDGYPSGGNYWSDYTGIDEKSGPNQNQPGSDGIGDTLYNIPGGTNRDRYPLMYPWGKPKGPKIAVEKEFIPSEITTISQEVVSAINITNIGDVDITSMTIMDEYVDNMAPNDPPELLVTITSDEDEMYVVMPENLTVTSTDDNIMISFELPLEVIPVFWENGMLQFKEETYYLESIPKDWVVGIQYLLYPLTELEIGTYYADAMVTAYSETGTSTTETATGTLIVLEPIETAPWT